MTDVASVTTEARIAGVWPVLRYVRDEMAARGWSEDNLLGRLAGNRRIAIETWMRIQACKPLEGLEAYHLSRAFGTSVELWQNLDNSFWEALRSDLYYLAKEPRE